MYRILLTILILAFATSVTCAAVCGQQHGQKHEDGTRCDECVSTVFESGTKMVDAGLISMAVAQPDDIGAISLHPVHNFVLSRQLPTDSPPSVTATSSILRI